MSAFKSSKGYSLIELMTIVVIVGLLASFAVPKYQGYVDKARIARCVAEIRYIQKDITAYFVDREKYPTSLAELGRSQSNMLDPWGNPYQYLKIAGASFTSRDLGGTTYYARAGRPSGPPESDAPREGGFWSGSWFVSEAWAAPDGGGGVVASPRKDRFLVPINSDYDLYSMGPDGQTSEPLTVPLSRDDIVRASDGAYVGVAENF